MWGLLIGLGGGMAAMYSIFNYKKGGAEKLAQAIVQQAEKEAQAKQAACEVQLKQKEIEQQGRLDKLSDQKLHKLTHREEKLDRRLALFEKKEKELHQLMKVAEEDAAQLALQRKESLAQLQSLAGMTTDDAKQTLFTRISHEMKEEYASFLVKQKTEMDNEVERYATSLIATAINRLTLKTVSEVAAITVSLPNQEIKGRVIGREGRNIRILEQLTGVNFLLDDTPNAIVISGFDPVRKEIARVALKELIQDGRIHPTRIEEVVTASTEKVRNQIKSYGEDAALRAGSLSFHPELLRYLGELHFRFSYGQNVLDHSLEVSYLMGLMASELQLDTERAKRIGLLHDIGKAVSHEVEGTHALIGQQIALKYGESEEVANGIGCHHDEIVPLSIEGSLCSAADSISGGRPGARSENLEQYLRRSHKLEQLSKQFAGVEKAYAMHAGREVRVIVEPDQFDDASTVILARDIAKKIEKELSYPGKIKVTVIREKRAVEYAL